MGSNDCPLSYFVRGIPRMIARGYGCGATGGRCLPSDRCDGWIKEADYDARIRSALVTQKEGWQPIETAPKDGTFVDLYCRREHCHGEVQNVRKCNAQWGTMVHQFTGVEFEGWRGISEMYADNTPTHWRPVPPPPQEGKT